MDKKIVLFDGPCNLCNWAVTFMISRDNKNKFLFCSLDSPKGQNILHDLGLHRTEKNSIILVHNNRHDECSTAVFKILKELRAPWNLLFIGILLPKFLRDGIYNLIAKNRYRLFGKKESCPLPKTKDKDRFLF